MALTVSSCKKKLSMPLKQIEKLGATLITSKFLTEGLLEADWFECISNCCQGFENVFFLEKMKVVRS